MDVAGEGCFPAVHLNELDAAEDLIHQSDTQVRDYHTFLAEVGRQPRGQHLQEMERGYSGVLERARIFRNEQDM